MLTTILLLLTYNTQLSKSKEENEKYEEFVVFITRPGENILIILNNVLGLNNRIFKHRLNWNSSLNEQDQFKLDLLSFGFRT